MADKLPWFPFYGSDFFGDEAVVEMSNDEVGAYLRLLWHQWTNGSIPSDRNRIAKLCGTRQLDLILSKFHTADDGGERLVNRKLLQIYAEQEDRRTRLALAGSKGGYSKATARLHQDGLASPQPGSSNRAEQSRTEQSKGEVRALDSVSGFTEVSNWLPEEYRPDFEGHVRASRSAPAMIATVRMVKQEGAHPPAVVGAALRDMALRGAPVTAMTLARFIAGAQPPRGRTNVAPGGYWSPEAMAARDEADKLAQGASND